MNDSLRTQCILFPLTFWLHLSLDISGRPNRLGSGSAELTGSAEPRVKSLDVATVGRSGPPLRY